VNFKVAITEMYLGIPWALVADPLNTFGNHCYQRLVLHVIGIAVRWN